MTEKKTEWVKILVKDRRRTHPVFIDGATFFWEGEKLTKWRKKNETDETSLLDNSSFIICSRAKGKHNGQESQKN